MTLSQVDQRTHCGVWDIWDFVGRQCKVWAHLSSHPRQAQMRVCQLPSLPKATVAVMTMWCHLPLIVNCVEQLSCLPGLSTCVLAASVDPPVRISAVPPQAVYFLCIACRPLLMEVKSHTWRTPTAPTVIQRKISVLHAGRPRAGSPSGDLGAGSKFEVLPVRGWASKHELPAIHHQIVFSCIACTLKHHNSA